MHAAHLKRVRETCVGIWIVGPNKALDWMTMIWIVPICRRKRIPNILLSIQFIAHPTHHVHYYFFDLEFENPFSFHSSFSFSKTPSFFILSTCIYLNISMPMGPWRMEYDNGSASWSCRYLFFCGFGSLFG